MAETRTPESSSELLVSVEGGVATLTLNRPDKKNALNAALVAALVGALDRFREDPEVRVIALRGAGDDFCSGADLAELRTSQSATVEQGLTDAQRLGDLFVRMRRHPRPIVAVVQGRALAGGAGMATGCDLVLAHEDAQLGYPEVHLGFVPAMVMNMLRRKTGEARAFELATRGGRITATEAERLGLVNHVFSGAEFESGVQAYLSELAAKPASAIELTKRLLYGLDGVPFDEGVRRAAEVNSIARMTEACKAGVKAFLERVSG